MPAKTTPGDDRRPLLFRVGLLISLSELSSPLIGILYAIFQPNNPEPPAAYLLQWLNGNDAELKKPPLYVMPILFSGNINDSTLSSAEIDVLFDRLFSVLPATVI